MGLFVRDCDILPRNLRPAESSLPLDEVPVFQQHKLALEKCPSLEALQKIGATLAGQALAGRSERLRQQLRSVYSGCHKRLQAAARNNSRAIEATSCSLIRITSSAAELNAMMTQICLNHCVAQLGDLPEAVRLTYQNKINDFAAAQELADELQQLERQLQSSQEAPDLALIGDFGTSPELAAQSDEWGES